MDIPINPVSWVLIAAGTKTVKTRPGNDQLGLVRVGETVTFVNREDGSRVTKEVVAVRHYPSSQAVVATEDLAKIGQYDSPAAYLERMAQFQSADQEKEHGIVAVEYI